MTTVSTESPTRQEPPLPEVDDMSQRLQPGPEVPLPEVPIGDLVRTDAIPPQSVWAAKKGPAPGPFFAPSIRLVKRQEEIRAEVVAELDAWLEANAAPVDWFADPTPVHCGFRWGVNVEGRVIELICTDSPAHDGKAHHAHDSKGDVVAEHVEPEPAARPEPPKRKPSPRKRVEPIAVDRGETDAR